MTTSREDFERAFKILSQFERQLIPANEFGWSYITSRVIPSKATLWRNIEFRDEFNRIKKLIRVYKNGKTAYDFNALKESTKDLEIKKLKREIQELETLLSRERERLAYAAVVARRENIDPAKFEKSSPLLSAVGRKNKT